MKHLEMPIISEIDQLIKRSCSACSELSSASDSQKVYVISDAREAKIIFDILIAYGLDAKLYHDDAQSKLYITLQKKKYPLRENWHLEAIATAETLLLLKKQLDQLSFAGKLAGSEYSLSMSPLAAGGKQILIHLPGNSSSTDNSGTNNTAPTSNQLPPAPPRRNVSYQPKQQENDDIFAGPTVTKKKGPSRLIKKGSEAAPDTLWKRTKLYIKGNIFYSMLVVIACILFVVVMFSFFSVSKGFLCPDFASLKDENPPWYCSQK